MRYYSSPELYNVKFYVNIASINSIKLEDIAMKKFYLVCLTLLSFGLSADVTVEKMSDIESRVDSMSLSELQDRRSFLMREERSLMATQSSTQNPSTVKTTSGRLAEIRAELSAIQKALIAIAGVAAISSLSDDSYDDNVPPVITLNGSNPDSVELGGTYTDAGATATDASGNTATATRTVNVVDTTAPVLTITGDNPATVELGDTYTDQGATAFDEFHGVTPVTSSGTVDTSTVGTYTITYSATDLDGNTATATRTVNVVDTIAPVITSAAVFEAPENQLAVGTVTATDLSGVLNYFVTGSYLEINQSTGVLTFERDPTDHETTPQLTASVFVTDSSGNSTEQGITVNVLDVNEAPIITSGDSFSADENQTAIGTVTAKDVDDGDTLTFSVSGSELSIDS